MAKGSGGIVGALKEQSKAILIMMGLAIVAVLAMIVLALFKSSVPNSTTESNTTIDLFIVAFALFGSFASITALVILVKAIIGIVKGLQ